MRLMSILRQLNSWYICGVAVLPEYRERGIASKLIEQSTQLGRQQGYDNVSLTAMLEKGRLISFYESMGFEITHSAPIVEHAKISAKGHVVLMETGSIPALVSE